MYCLWEMKEESTVDCMYVCMYVQHKQSIKKELYLFDVISMCDECLAMATRLKSVSVFSIFNYVPHSPNVCCSFFLPTISSSHFLILLTATSQSTACNDYDDVRGQHETVLGISVQFLDRGYDIKKNEVRAGCRLQGRRPAGRLQEQEAKTGKVLLVLLCVWVFR